MESNVLVYLLLCSLFHRTADLNPAAELKFNHPTQPGFQDVKRETVEAVRYRDYPYRLDRLKSVPFRWCVVTLRPSSKVEDHRFRGIMWGEKGTPLHSSRLTWKTL